MSGEKSDNNNRCQPEDHLDGQEMNILAIDPGPTESAYVKLDQLCKELIVEIRKVSNDEMLHVIGNSFFENLVIEKVACMGMAVGEDVLETVFWSGRFRQIWKRSFHRIKRHEIKMHLCGNMRAKDGNIRQALIDRFGPPGTKKNRGATHGISGDMWSALAVGVTFLDKQAHA